MNDNLQSASTSGASTSSAAQASTSKTSNPYLYVYDSDISSDEEESEIVEEESSNSNEVVGMCEESDDNMDDTSWSSVSTVSCGNKSSSEHSEIEKLLGIKEKLSEEKVSAGEEKIDDSTQSILLLVQVLVKTINLIVLGWS